MKESGIGLPKRIYKDSDYEQYWDSMNNQISPFRGLPMKSKYNPVLVLIPHLRA